jgi:glutamate-1-semialdehyde 2,1-aminomutase
MENLKSKLKKSLSLQKKAKNLIPGISQLISKSPNRFTEGLWPTYFSKAKGAEVWDLDNNRYLDMSIGGIGANIFGYADPDVDNAVIEAIKKGTSSSLNCPEDVELAEILCELHPWAERVRYARTGGEAMTVAIRIARTYTNKDKIAFCGYHGWHDWYLSANLGEEDALKDHMATGLVPRGVPKSLKGTSIPFYFNNVEQLKGLLETHGHELAAVVMEPIRNEEPTTEFINLIKEINTEYKIPLIIDEISSGFRLNTGGAHMLFSIEPDVAVFSKGMSNGYPMAAIIGKAPIMEACQKSFISSTNWTERIGPVAALTTIKKHRDKNVAKHLLSIGNMVQEGIQRLSKDRIKIGVSGISPMTHFSFELENPNTVKAFFIQQMLQKNILSSNLFYAMYSHTPEHVTAYLKAFDTIIDDINESLKNDNMSELLLGNPAVSGFKRYN